MPVNGRGFPVCVDLERTLIAGDLVWESLVALFKRRALTALRVVGALVLRGRAHFKKRLADERPVDPASLPYRPEVLEGLAGLRERGAYLVLATASDERHGRAVADHLGIFAEVVASDGRTNVSSGKTSSLAERFGPDGFHHLRHPGTPGVDPPARTRSRLDLRAWLRAPLVRAMRPHQWAKNMLVFVPLIAAHQFWRLDLWIASALTFLAFGLCASAIYVLNDISDIEADRLHPRKRTRPFASGELSIPAGFALAAVLVVSSFTLALAGVSWQLAAAMLVYFIVTSAYSLRLKREPILDVFTLAGLYVLRIVSGGIATATPLTSWLLAFALFLFLSLAFVKRYVELVAVNGRMAGRGYGPDDMLWMHAVGTCVGYMAVLVLALYVNAPDVTVLYSRPQVLWLLCPLMLFWLTRLWFRAGRKVLRDDPVLEALKDSVSYVVVAIAAAVMLAAI
jgi:4-hydroxybenzoate polyprenyltransferase